MKYECYQEDGSWQEWAIRIPIDTSRGVIYLHRPTTPWTIRIQLENNSQMDVIIKARSGIDFNLNLLVEYLGRIGPHAKSGSHWISIKTTRYLRANKINKHPQWIANRLINDRPADCGVAIGICLSFKFQITINYPRLGTRQAPTNCTRSLTNGDPMNLHLVRDLLFEHHSILGEWSFAIDA